MFHVFKREMRGNLAGILVWSAVMLVMALVGFGEYGLVMGEGANFNLDGVIAMMPRILQVMMGMGSLPVNTPEGWFVCMYLWCAMIACIHAALSGAGLISKEESDKTSEFLFTRPIKRSTAISGKILAGITGLAVVVFVGWLGTMMVFAPHVRETGLIASITLIMLPCMFITALIFMFAGLCLSAVLTGRGRAAQYSAVILIITYFIGVAIEMVGDVQYLNFLSPFRYFDAVRVLDNGMEWPYLLLSAGLIAAMGYATHFFFRRRDLHG